MKDPSPSVSKARTWLRTRLPTLCALATLAFLLALGTHVQGSVVGAWRMLGVAALSPSFADTRSVTQYIDCVRAGTDPYETKSCDSFHRLYNYPPIWLSLRYLGVTSRSTLILALTMACLTWAAFLVLFRAERMLSAVIIFLAALSPPVLLAMERGNIDLVVFALMVLGFFLIESRLARGRSAANGLLIVLLTVLKVYPIVAVAVLARSRRWLAAVLATGVAATAALLLTAGPRLRQISGNTPQDTTDSFGALPFFFVMAQHFAHGLIPSILDHNFRVSGGAFLIAVASVGVGWRMRGRLDRILPPFHLVGPTAAVAASGLAIFCFVFARGSNYTYRLIFLLGALAFLIDDLNESGSNRALLLSVLVLSFLWTPFRSTPLLFQALDGAMFAVACAWLGTALISRLRPSIAENRTG